MFVTSIASMVYIMARVPMERHKLASSRNSFGASSFTMEVLPAVDTSHEELSKYRKVGAIGRSRMVCYIYLNTCPA